MMNIDIGGSGEIRTHEGLAPSLVFKTSAFNHSATLPLFETNCTSLTCVFSAFRVDVADLSAYINGDDLYGHNHSATLPLLLTNYS